MLLKLFFNLLLYITLILIDETASFSEENSGNDTSLANAYRLPNYIIPYHYMIHIRLSLYYKVAKATHFFGECHVYIKIHRPTYRISFHAQKPQINVNYVILKKNANESEKEIRYSPKKRTYNSENHILNFYFIKEIPNGDYIFNISYSGFLNNNENIFKNVYVNNTRNTRWLYAMHLQATGARQIFPCWDEPEFKATFNISIKHHEEYKVLSNMYYKTKTDLREDKIQWTHFNITPEISTYHVAICLLPDKWFKLILSYYYPNQTNNATMMNLSKIIVWNRNYSQLTFAKEVTEKALISFKNDWKNLEEIPEIQFVLIPGFPHNNIEKWGLILYKETTIIYDKNIDSLSHKIEVTNLITRQMAHQWIGNLVSPSWWSYHWLNQGIATLLGIDVLHKNFPDFRMPDLFVVQMQQESLRLDGYSMKPLISEISKPTEINSLFSFSYYIKAPAILRMLQCVLTDEIFKKGIEKFYKTQSATLDNFYDVMQTVYDAEKKSYVEHFIIKDTMNAWMKQKHYPVLKVQTMKSYNLINASYSILMEIENYDSLDLEYNWWIPITITKQTELNFTISTIWHASKLSWVEVSQPTHVSYYIRNFSVEENEWYIINLQQMGYYRVNYGENNWRNIARYLNSVNYMNIHVLNRAQIIDDAYHFMMEGTLNFFTFLELTEYLSQETDYVAWYPMFKALEDISRTFPFPKGKVNFFKAQILNSLNKLLKNINYDKKSNEKPDDLIDCLRQEASKWACILDLSNCLKAAETKLHQHLTSPKTNTLLPWWRHWTFCNGLRANRNMWNKARRIHLNNPYLISSKFLTCSNNTNIIKNYTNILFHKLNNKMIYNHLNDIHYIIAKHANNNEILDNILKKLNKIPRKYVIALLIDIINHVYSEKQLDKIQMFVDIFKEGVTIENVLGQQPLFDQFNEILTINCVTKIDRLIPSHMKRIQPIITGMITDVIGYSLIIDKIDIRRSEISIHLAPFTDYIQF